MPRASQRGAFVNAITLEEAALGCGRVRRGGGCSSSVPPRRRRSSAKRWGVDRALGARPPAIRYGSTCSPFRSSVMALARRGNGCGICRRALQTRWDAAALAVDEPVSTCPRWRSGR